MPVPSCLPCFNNMRDRLWNVADTNKDGKLDASDLKPIVLMAKAAADRVDTLQQFLTAFNEMAKSNPVIDPITISHLNNAVKALEALELGLRLASNQTEKAANIKITTDPQELLATIPTIKGMSTEVQNYVKTIQGLGGKINVNDNDFKNINDTLDKITAMSNLFKLASTPAAFVAPPQTTTPTYAISIA